VLTLEALVLFVVYLMVAGLILALLYYLVNFVAAQFPGPGADLFARVARVVLVVVAVLVLIDLLLGLVGRPLLIR
jgi:hypothetical protein